MNLENKNIEHVTQLGLTLDCSNESSNGILRKVGAGANAASNLDTSYVVRTPLAELVWSPHKGLSKVVLLPPQIITARRKRIDMHIDEQYITASQAILHVSIGDVDGSDTINEFPGMDAVIMPLGGSDHEHTISVMEKSVADTLLVNNKEATEDARIELDYGHRDESNNQILVMDPIPNQMSPGRREVDLVSVTAEEKRNKMKETTSFPLDKLEFTDENDLRTLVGDNACPVASKTLALEFGGGVKNIPWKGKEIVPAHMNVSLERSPSCSKVRMNQKKGKRKPLSDGDVEKKIPNVDSHESIESCNSAGFFVTSKKQQNFEQQLIDGNKKVKRQIQVGSDSRSSTRYDNSFMSWISNMTKGFTKSKEDMAPSLKLALAIPNQACESSDQKFILCTEDQDPTFRNMGFQSIFRSIYCSNTKVNETIMLDADYETREYFNKVELDNMMCDTNATPIPCHGVSGNLCKQSVQPNENRNESIAANGAGPSNKLQGLSSQCSAIQKSHNTNSMDNKSNCNLEFDKENHRTSLNSSMDELKMRTHEKIDSVLPSKSKNDDNFNDRNNLLQSFWIKQFYPKKGLSHDLVQHSLSMDCIKAKATTGFSKIRDRIDQKKVSLFQNLGSSEVMASTLARKLGAVKPVLPSDKTGNGDHACTHCSFCGKRGHLLRDCFQITEIEVKDLLRSINSYDGAEKLPCICIRCFQLDHWAAECPSASSRGQPDLEGGKSVSHHYIPSKMDLNAYNQNPKLLNYEEKQFQAAGASTGNDGTYFTVQPDLSLKLKFDEVMNPEKMVSSSSSLKRFIPSRRGTDNVKKMTTTKQSSDIPKEIFDAVKMLRLARSDILKWISSHKSLAVLNGFFVRLRLGQWEEGLGGTGYHVACITEEQSERSAQNDKTISVNIGGVKCAVESQVVSNQDFLKNEIVAWWQSTAKIGCKVPTYNHLKAKTEEKKTLGF